MRLKPQLKRASLAALLFLAMSLILAVDAQQPARKIDASAVNVPDNYHSCRAWRSIGKPTPFGKALQVLPGREGQIGLRIEF